MCPFLLPSVFPQGSHASSLSVEHARDVWIQMKAMCCRGPGGHRRNPRSLALGTTLHGPTVALFSCLCGSPGHRASSCQERPAHSSLHWLASPRMCTDQPALLTARGGGGARPVAKTAHTVSLHKTHRKDRGKKSKKYLKWEFPGVQCLGFCREPGFNPSLAN